MAPASASSSASTAANAFQVHNSVAGVQLPADLQRRMEQVGESDGDHVGARFFIHFINEFLGTKENTLERAPFLCKAIENAVTKAYGEPVICSVNLRDEAGQSGSELLNAIIPQTLDTASRTLQPLGILRNPLTLLNTSNLASTSKGEGITTQQVGVKRARPGDESGRTSGDENTAALHGSRTKAKRPKVVKALPAETDIIATNTWLALRSGYAAKLSGNGSNLLGLEDQSHFVRYGEFFQGDVFGAEGLQRIADIVQLRKARAADASQGNSVPMEIDSAPTGSLLGYYGRSARNTRRTNLLSAAAIRETLLAKVEWYRSWSTTYAAAQDISSPTRQSLIQRARALGKTFAPGYDMRSILWDIAVEDSSAPQEISTPELRDKALHRLRDDLEVGKRLEIMRDTFGPGIYNFLPANTPSVIRRGRIDVFRSFVSVLNDYVPSIRSACELVAQSLRISNPSELLVVTATASVFESRVAAILRDGPFAAQGLEQEYDQSTDGNGL